MMKKIMVIILVCLVLLVGLPTVALSAEPESEFVTEGQVYSTSRIAEYDGLSAFPVRRNNQYYAHFEDGTRIWEEQIDTYYQQYTVKFLLLSEDELLVVWGVPIIKADHYKILSNGLELLSRQELGDSKTRFLDAIKLESGKVLVLWYEHTRQKYVSGETVSRDIGLAYRRTDGAWITLPYTIVERPNNQPSTKGVLCQHPTDNSIWAFTLVDGNPSMQAICLSDSGDTVSVDWINNDFITWRDGDMVRGGELPFITAVPDPSRNSILLAYQNRNYKFFSIKPFMKGANVCVIQVSEDGDKELLFLLDRWVERISPFALGILPSGEFWMAYCPIDPDTLNYMNLHLMKSSKPEEEIALGQVSRRGLINSNYHLLFNLPDGVYSYQVAGEPQPPPTITVFMGKATWELSGAEKSAAMVIYATTEAEAMDKLIEYIMAEFPEATDIQFSDEAITADIFKVLE